jgi:hypothetical protein
MLFLYLILKLGLINKYGPYFEGYKFDMLRGLMIVCFNLFSIFYPVKFIICFETSLNYDAMEALSNKLVIRFFMEFKAI